MLMVLREELSRVVGGALEVFSGHQEESMNVLVSFQGGFRYCWIHLNVLRANIGVCRWTLVDS